VLIDFGKACLMNEAKKTRFSQEEKDVNQELLKGPTLNLF